MTRKPNPAIVLLVLSIAVPFGQAMAQDASQLFAAGSAAFSDGDYLQALSLFEDARDAGSRGPAVQYNIGVAQYRLGNYAEADVAFRIVADDYPAMRALALYNLGLVRLRQDRDDEAREFFEQAQRDSNDAKLTQLAETMLRRIDSPDQPTRRSAWIRLADFSVGYDDNVALVDDSSLPAGQSVDSAFTELFGVVSGPLFAAPGFRFDGSAYAVRYDAASEFDQLAVRLGGVYQWRIADWRIAAGPRFNHSTLDGDGFERRIGVDLNVRRNLSSTTSFALRFSHDEIDNIDARFAFVEGSRDQLGVSLNRHISSGHWTLGYDLESNDRLAATVSPTRNRLWFRYRYSADPDWTADVQIAFRSSAYDDLVASRDEDLVDLSLGYQWRFSAGWQLNGRYRWSDNDSNNELFSYSRSRLTFGLSKNF